MNSPLLALFLAGAAVEPLRLAVPVYREVNTHIHRPSDLRPGEKRPAVLLIGGPGHQMAEALAKEQRLVCIHFSPAENIPAEFRGWEERLGHAGQDAIAIVLKHLLKLPEVDTNNVGLVTFSFGVVGGTGALARYPELQVKFLIDWEGPSGPQNLRWVPRDHKIVRNHLASDEAFWKERTASEFIKKVRCRYLRVQAETDHVQVLGQNQHAIEMLNNAADGLCPWTRCNDNPPNIRYDEKQPNNKWLPGKPPRADMEKLIIRYVREMTSTETAQPIHVTFVIHFDPLPAPGSKVPRWAYEAERDNLAWLVEFLERLEKEKGKDFVPRLTLEMAGDHAEWYLEDTKGFELLRRLHAKGIHSWGTHFHRNYQTENHVWIEAPQSSDSPPRVTYDHIMTVDKLIGKLIGSDDPKAIRQVNRTITGHFLDMEMAAKKGFDTLTGGRNEAMNLFFDHDVYTPWRPAMDWSLSEDLSSRWILIPQAPVPGRIGEHSPLPTGVSEEYTRGMRTQIWQDLSVAALKRKFLHLFLEPKSETGKLRVFGWHEHTNDLFPDSTPGPRKKLRRELVELVEWLNANFIGNGTRYSNCDEVRDEFLAWEKAHPKQSSFDYSVKKRDWEKYPYHLKGLARELMYSHHDKEISAFNDKGVHVHKLLKTDGRNWSVRDGKVVCDRTTKDVYLLWSDKGTVTIDFSKIVAGKLRRVEGASGKESVAEATKLVVTTEPVIVEQ
jgi:hypothetical protein